MEEEATAAAEIEHHELRPFGIEVRGIMAQAQGSFLSTTSVTSCTISYTRSAKTILYVLVLITCVPFIIGAAFTSIFTEDKNFLAAVSAFFTACFSLGTLSLLILHLLGKLETYHDTGTLEGLKLLGMLSSVASGISLGVYTILAFFNKQDFSIYGMNFFSSAVFSGLCLACSIQLYITSQWYQNAIRAAANIAQSATSHQLRPMSSAVN